MKKMMLAGLIFCAVALLSGCGEEKNAGLAAGAPFAVETVVPTAKAAAETLGVTETVPAAEPCAVILTAPYESGYELSGSFDYDAFLEYLPEYFGSLYGESLVVAVRDMIDTGGTEEERGVITVLAEYHALEAVESGRSVGTLRGGCNFFFSYDRESGADFAERKFTGDILLHDLYSPAGTDLSHWTATVDTRGRVQLVKAGQSVIETPAEYCWDLADFEDAHELYVNGGHIVLLLREHASAFAPVSECTVFACVSTDGGESWEKTALDFTPLTTTTIYPVTNLVLNMRDDMHGTAILGTNRTEVFFYVTDDGGKTWEKRRNFRLLNYQNEALCDGGMVTDSLGFISFIPREGKNPNVYITRDGGKTWALMDITLPAGYDDADAYGKAAYLQEGRIVLPIICGGETLYWISEDEGKTWKWQK